MSGRERWTWQPLLYPWGTCQRCHEADAMVIAYEGRVWRETLCAVCAEAHRAVHGDQLDLFGAQEEEEP